MSIGQKEKCKMKWIWNQDKVKNRAKMQEKWENAREDKATTQEHNNDFHSTKMKKITKNGQKNELKPKKRKMRSRKKEASDKNHFKQNKKKKEEGKNVKQMVIYISILFPARKQFEEEKKKTFCDHKTKRKKTNVLEMLKATEKKNCIRMNEYKAF